MSRDPLVYELESVINHLLGMRRKAADQGDAPLESHLMKAISRLIRAKTSVIQKKPHSPNR